MTRGELLVHSIAFALIGARKTVRGLSQELSRAERLAVANAAIDELKRHGDPWGLSEEIESPVGKAHST